MVSTSYPADLGDWRGLFIRHLSDALARRNNLAVKLWAPPGQTHPNAEPVTTAQESAWLLQLMQQGGIAHLLRNGGINRFAAPIKLLGFLRQAYSRNKDVDLYHINWLQNALPVPDNGIASLGHGTGYRHAIVEIANDENLAQAQVQTTPHGNLPKRRMDDRPAARSIWISSKNTIHPIRHRLGLV